MKKYSDVENNLIIKIFASYLSLLEDVIGNTLTLTGHIYSIVK